MRLWERRKSPAGMLPPMNGHLGRSAAQGGAPVPGPSRNQPTQDVLAAVLILFVPLMVWCAPGKLRELANAESVE